MSVTKYSEENLPDLLPLYYNRLFPQLSFYNWLSYGNRANFQCREISFTLHGDIYIRFQTFDSMEEFGSALSKRCPIKIDIGAIYKQPLKGAFAKTPCQREIVFDIDMTDYDEIRTCCSGADICNKCWKFMTLACKILNVALRDDFNFQHILWVFSGRRGIHCWVGDKSARKLVDSCRSALAEYLYIHGSGPRNIKLPSNIHFAIKRALDIIDQYFEEIVLIDQDILGTDERVMKFLKHIETDIRNHFMDVMLEPGSSIERWSRFVTTFQTLYREQKIPPSVKHMVEEFKLFYAYPRLDINVTKSMNHLLKAPFCVHPKTGKISVPFKIESVDTFDPEQVPTITQVIAEISEYDSKAKELEQNEHVKKVQIKDYKKTSLFKYVAIFNEFLRGINMAAIKARSVPAEI